MLFYKCEYVVYKNYLIGLVLNNCYRLNNIVIFYIINMYNSSLIKISFKSELNICELL